MFLVIDENMGLCLLMNAPLPESLSLVLICEINGHHSCVAFKGVKICLNFLKFNFKSKTINVVFFDQLLGADAHEIR